MTLDGDYIDIDYATGDLRLAPWDITGVSGPDCLYCHRAQRNITTARRNKTALRQGFSTAGLGDNNYSWRATVLGAAAASKAIVIEPIVVSSWAVYDFDASIHISGG